MAQSLAKRLAVNCLLLFVSGAHAQLRWDVTRLEMTATQGSSEISAEFRFVNAGNRAVTIESVRASCGCTTPILDKQVFLPGEPGTLRTTVRLSGRPGQRRTEITVRTSASPEPTVLDVTVNIPEVLRISPAQVTWREDEAEVPKVITLTAPGSERVFVAGASSQSKAFTAQLETVQAGERYLVTVTPKPGASPGTAGVIEITVALGTPPVLQSIPVTVGTQSKPVLHRRGPSPSDTDRARQPVKPGSPGSIRKPSVSHDAASPPA